MEEREVAGDNAIRASLDVYTPVMANSHRFLAFIDIGQYWRENTLAGEPDEDFIWTVGLGWRWNFQNRLSASVDLGYVLNNVVNLTFLTTMKFNDILFERNVILAKEVLTQ
ncbi:MAG TPA: hypothetical protein V6D07_16855 [Trichocoleus sp.]